MQKNKGDGPVGTVQVLSKMKNSEEASRLIKMAVDAVIGVLRNRGWKVGTVTEFYPKTANLLGLNVNRGQVIKIRLRNASNPDIFLEYHDILGTMVHEVTHIKISPHDATFYKLMDELYDEVEGVTSFPFPGGSSVLGGGKPGKPSKQLIREAALSRQKNSTLYAGSGQKLGSVNGVCRSLTPAQLRAKALEAAENRLRDTWSQNNVDDEEEELKSMKGRENVVDDAIDIRDVLYVNSNARGLVSGFSGQGEKNSGSSSSSSRVALCSDCLPSQSPLLARKRNLNCLCCQEIQENGVISKFGSALGGKEERVAKVQKKDENNSSARDRGKRSARIVDLTSVDDFPEQKPNVTPESRRVVDIIDISDSPTAPRNTATSRR